MCGSGCWKATNASFPVCPSKRRTPFSILVRGFFGIKICSESFICVPLGTSALSKGQMALGMWRVLRDLIAKVRGYASSSNLRKPGLSWEQAALPPLLGPMVELPQGPVDPDEPLKELCLWEFLEVEVGAVWPSRMHQTMARKRGVSHSNKTAGRSPQ